MNQLLESKHRARHPHLCDKCARVIDAKEYYWKTVIKEPSGLKVVRKHTKCRAIDKMPVELIRA